MTIPHNVVTHEEDFLEVFDPMYRLCYEVPHTCIAHLPPPRMKITRLVICRNYVPGDLLSCTMGSGCKMPLLNRHRLSIVEVFDSKYKFVKEIPSPLVRHLPAEHHNISRFVLCRNYPVKTLRAVWVTSASSCMPMSTREPQVVCS